MHRQKVDTSGVHFRFEKKKQNIKEWIFFGPSNKNKNNGKKLEFNITNKGGGGGGQHCNVWMDVI